MDFIEGLPRANNKSVILMVVDHLSKAAHLIPLGHPYTATLVTRAFFNEIVWLHGLQKSIVSVATRSSPATFGRSFSACLGHAST